MEDNTEICLRKRLMMLNNDRDNTLMFTLKQSKSMTIDLVNDVSNNNVPQNDKSEDSLINNKLDTNVVSVDDCSSSELPETTRSHNLNSSQHDITTFTLKDLKAIEIDLTSDSPEKSFTHLKDISPKNIPRIIDKFHGMSPKTDSSLPDTIHLQPVLNVESASSSDSELPCGIFPETLSERFRLNSNQDSQDISKELPLPETKIAAPKGQQKRRHFSETNAEKKLQAKVSHFDYLHGFDGILNSKWHFFKHKILGWVRSFAIF